MCLGNCPYACAKKVQYVRTVTVSLPRRTLAAGLFYAYTTGTLGTVLQTISYGYTDSNWKDKLTSYDGMDISYDAIGNITGYNDMMFVWGAGRRLSACMADSMILFGYNSQGERIRKFAAGVATLYTMHGKLLTHLTKGSDYMHFYYDANSRPAMVDYNGTHYTYLYNLQGDVVGLVDSTNSIVVEYKYDAWGKLLSTTGTLASTLGYLNPFRYRCYIYDEETGLYYLHSRYYNPMWGRFVSADKYAGSVGTVLCHNIFCYCRNSPIIRHDPNGYFDWKAIGIIDYWEGKLVAKICVRDKFAYTIMERWFNGLGKDLTIADDIEWNQYLLNNNNFITRIKKHAKAAVHSGTYRFDVKNEWLSLDLSDHGEGDYCTGYGLINGTNSTVGGFCVSGTVQHIEGNRYRVIATYELNDRVDPGNYGLDWILAVGAWCVLGPCINYTLQISGTVEFDFYY